MQTGALRHRISIQQLVKSTDPFNIADSWIEVIKLWAKVAPVSGKETYQSGQQTMKVSHEITIRYPGKHVQIAAGNKVILGKRCFELQTGIFNPDERNIYLTLLAFETDPIQ